MFKGQPKGLIVAALTNLGERFGFYTMMAILVFFLQARYGMSVAEAGSVYSWFYFGIYALALVGGILADNYTGLGRTIFVGVLTMLVGYGILAVPGMGIYVTYGGLFVIALGNGLFKGNLQALVGNLYDAPEYRSMRDRAFSIFYMFINIGAFFAPSAAEAMLNFLLKKNGFLYNGQLVSLCWDFQKGALSGSELTRFHEVASNASLTPITDYTQFAKGYIDAVSTGYNYAFGIAGLSMVISMLVFLIYKKHLKPGDYNTKTATSQGVQVEVLTPKQTRDRFVALGLVFLVVIFFWMSFHQNGLTLNQFAKDYTTPTVSGFTNIFFNLGSCLSLIVGIVGVVFAVKRSSSSKKRIIGMVLAIAGAVLTYLIYNTFEAQNPITPAKFQQFNPIFIVALTSVVVGLFTWMNNRGIEPSTPRKIGYGMIIAALGFVIMLVGSIGLTAPSHLASSGTEFASPYLLINTYFVLTIAELFLSPMGISFVSKVAPPKYKALMQGGWLGATAIGNKLLFVGSYFWGKLELWQLWLIFVVCCLVSAAIIFSLMKFLERVSKS
jgi:Dipeptide/tripeptide permease